MNLKEKIKEVVAEIVECVPAGIEIKVTVEIKTGESKDGE